MAASARLYRPHPHNPFRDRAFVAAAAAYLGGVAIWAYAVAARSDDYGGSPAAWWVVAGAFAVGLAAGRWEAVVVPFLAPVVAGGAGNGTNPDSDISIAGELLLFYTLPSLAAVFAGVWLRESLYRRRRRRS
jgi:hypothetical protein